ncbi:MAG: hypothetical protein KAI91_05635 [Candidatus Omnitrophica bacterium]|nr:hypothetical protein [Candidatus Omnitrophota bacterium]MCK5288080.1 hypothetical protein [Candidatus Omnitrophota bacterium]MCK5393801.1 hypothetical protein [Candidatus Omnitrophota bacterium]
MKKFLPLIFVLLIFMAGLVYINQKINIYIEAYNLSNNYSCYNESIDKRDFLMHNLAKEISLVKVNEWVRSENYSLVEKENILVRSNKTIEKIGEDKFAVYLDHFLDISGFNAPALAKEKK